MGIKTVETRWRAVALVCRKCSRKLKGGFGPDGRDSLSKALRRELDVGGGRKARVVVKTVGCFDICPKGAVAAVNAARPDTLLIIPRNTSVDRAATALGLGTEPPQGVTGAVEGSRRVA